MHDMGNRNKGRSAAKSRGIVGNCTVSELECGRHPVSM